MNQDEILKNDIKKLEQICSEGVEIRFKETIIVKDHFEKSIEVLNDSNNITRIRIK